MRYLRIYADADGESHMEDVDLPGELGSEPGRQLLVETSAPFAVTAFAFRRVVEEDDDDCPHNPKQRQFLVQLTGESEVRTSDGDVRRLGPGSVVLVEDMTGKGHVTRGLGEEERMTLTVALPPLP